jgi:hypothetical protein
VTLAYGDGDWSHQAEREANPRVIGAREQTLLPASGHFSSLDGQAKSRNSSKVP